MPFTACLCWKNVAWVLYGHVPYPVCRVSSACPFVACMLLYAPGRMHAACVLQVCCMCAASMLHVCVLHGHCMHAAFMLCVCCMYAACKLPILHVYMYSPGCTTHCHWRRPIFRVSFRASLGLVDYSRTTTTLLRLFVGIV